MLSRFFLNNSNKKMLAPHAVDIAVTISSLIASLCFTFAELPIRRHFSLRQVKLCIGQRKQKQTFTTQGSTDRPTKRVNSCSLTKLLFRILQNSRKNDSDICFRQERMRHGNTATPLEGLINVNLGFDFILVFEKLLLLLPQFGFIVKKKH